MLRACEVNLRYAIYLLLVPCLLAVTTRGSYFELIKSSGQQRGGQRTGAFLQRTFHQCGRDPKCTHVVKLDGSEEYVMVHGEDALEKMTNTRIVWRKVAVNFVRGNIALGKPSTLSSIWGNGNKTIAALAFDGNKATTIDFCAQSKTEEPAWLRVDLQASAIIEAVNIISLEADDREMKAFDVRAGNNFQNGGIGNPPCQLNVSMPAGSSTLHLQCPSGLKGRYVTINTQGEDFIEICEVEVYGYYI